MKVVGFYLNGIVPLENAINKIPESNDVVEQDGQHYRIFFDGNKKKFWSVQSEWERTIEQYVPGGSANDVMGSGW